MYHYKTLFLCKTLQNAENLYTGGMLIVAKDLFLDPKWMLKTEDEQICGFWPLEPTKGN